MVEIRKTKKFDVAEHLRTPEEMAAYREVCMEEAIGDASLIAKALGDTTRAKGMSQVARDAGYLGKVSTKHCPGSGAQGSAPSSTSSML